MIRLEDTDYGYYIIRNTENNDTVLVQMDYDFPSLATNFGWSVSRVKCESGHRYDCDCDSYTDCDHSETDGTIDCKECGMKANIFITSAREYLDESIDNEIGDPGYFD